MGRRGRNGGGGGGGEGGGGYNRRNKKKGRWKQQEQGRDDANEDNGNEKPPPPYPHEEGEDTGSESTPVSSSRSSSSLGASTESWSSSWWSWSSSKRSTTSTSFVSTSSSSSSSKHFKTLGWDRERGRDELYQYLAEYKQLALQSHSFTSLLSIPGLTSWGSSITPPPRVVGGVQLPELTQHVLQGPCLSLPSSLTPKQRRIVHEICTDLDLFHCTLNVDHVAEEDENLREGGAAQSGDGQNEDAVPSEKVGGRTVFVSPYADGFDGCVESVEGTLSATTTNQPSRIVPAYRFVSWYSKYHKASPKEKRKQSPSQDGRTYDNDDFNDADGWRDQTHLVEALWDQPGDCLRSGRDVMDFCALEHDTLESIQQTKTKHKAEEQQVPWMLVDTPELLRECVDELSTAHEVGFDVEAYNKSKSCQLTCLLQLKAGDTGKEYVIDPLAPGMWENMRWLRPIFEDPQIVKIGHSIGSLDVRCLHRDFGIWVVNAFDTYEAAKTLQQMDNHAPPSKASSTGKPNNRKSNHYSGNNNDNGLGLTAVCQRYGAPHVVHHQHLKAQYQRCEWRARPLSVDMLEYARLDVRYLIGLRTLMMRDLTRAELYDKRLDQLRKESRLVAEALEAVARMEDAYELAHSAAVPNQAVGAEPACETSGPTDSSAPLGLKLDPQFDDETFKTSHQREAMSTRQSTRSVGEAGYFTAASSLSDDDVNDVDVDDYDGGGLLNVMPRKRVVLSPAVVANADTLRRQPRLMQVLTSSQERCLSLWSQSNQHQHPHQSSGKVEKSLLDLWFCQQKDRDDWDDTNVHLYLELVEWRSRVAEALGCHEELVVDIEFLVHVAWKMPTTTGALRRISWTLPDVLLDFDVYRSQLLDLVMKHKRDHRVDDDILFYRTVTARYRRSRALVATALVACAAAAIVTASRRVKRR